MQKSFMSNVRKLKAYIQHNREKETLSVGELKQNIKTNLLKTPEEQFNYYSPIRGYTRLMGTIPPVIFKKNTVVGCGDCGYTKEFLAIRNFDRKNVYVCRRCGSTDIKNLDIETQCNLDALYENLICDIAKEMFS